MTTPNKSLTIHADTTASTAAIAEPARVPFLVAQSMVQRLATDGLVASVPDPILDLWKLTDDGRTAAASNL